MAIGDILTRAARKYEDRKFGEFPESGRSISFSELNSETSKIGGFLYRESIKPGQRVGVLMRNGEEMIKVILGVMRAGCVAMPMNPYESVQRIKYIIEHSDTEILFILKEFSLLANNIVSALKRDLKIIVVDDDTDVFSESDTPDFSDIKIATDQPALLLYTSGTTGKPKGVLLSHGSLVNNARYVEEAHALWENDKALCILPIYHINGLVFTLIAPLLTGGAVVMPHKFSVKRFWSVVADYEVTWVSAVPTILTLLVNDYEHHHEHYLKRHDKLRFIRSASMMLPVSVQKEFEKRFDCLVIEALGITEAGGQVFSNPCNRELRKYGSVGIPFGNDVKIVDPEGIELGVMREGEILVKGDNLMLEYFNDKTLTEEAFLDGWFKTGDIGLVDNDGYYFITGRKKEIIIRGGEKISPLEIDNVLYLHPGIKEAAAVGIPDALFGEEVKAFVVLKKESEYAEKDIIEFCKGYLSKFKCPKSVEFIARLPKGPSGKIQRLKLLEKDSLTGKHEKILQ